MIYLFFFFGLTCNLIKIGHKKCVFITVKKIFWKNSFLGFSNWSSLNFLPKNRFKVWFFFLEIFDQNWTFLLQRGAFQAVYFVPDVRKSCKIFLFCKTHHQLHFCVLLDIFGQIDSVDYFKLKWTRIAILVLLI